MAIQPWVFCATGFSEKNPSVVGGQLRILHPVAVLVHVPERYLGPGDWLSRIGLQHEALDVSAARARHQREVADEDVHHGKHVIGLAETRLVARRQ